MLNPGGLQESIICPVCRQPVGPGQYAGPQDIEPAARASLQAKHPGWQPEQGVCPNCLQATLNELLGQMEDETEPSSGRPPVYGILPVGLRLGYNNRYNGRGVTIAFLDSGFSNHPDLAGRIKLYVDASTEDITEKTEVETSGVLSWHGTMTSVVACGSGSLSKGLYRGLASEAEVVLIRVSDPEGHVNEEGIGRGLAWLLANGRRCGVQIVNVSLGGDHPASFASNPVDLMVEALVAQNVLVVCAAGNAGERFLVPPASAPAAITVGGLNDKNTLDPEIYELWHSNYGQTRSGVWKPELVAPSLWLAAPVLQESSVAEQAATLKRLLAAEPAEMTALLEDAALLEQAGLPPEACELSYSEIRPHLRQAWRGQKLLNEHYQHVDGTSFAAPIVSSVAAQMLQANPDLSAAGLKDLIMRTARYLPEVPPDHQGHGVIDPWAAVLAALATAAKKGEG